MKKLIKVIINFSYFNKNLSIIDVFSTEAHMKLNSFRFITTFK